MQPQQPYNQPSPSQYEFITNPQSNPGASGTTSVTKRLVIAAICGVLLLIVASLIFNLIRGSDKSFPAVLSVVQQQQELIHLTENSTAQPGISALNSEAAVTVNLTVTSQQQELLNLLRVTGHKLKPEQLLARINKQTDAELEDAVAGGTYNSVFRSALKTELAVYKQLLSQAYKDTKSVKSREILKKDFEAAKLLEQKLGSNDS
jgi:competence protein ComGC